MIDTIISKAKPADIKVVLDYSFNHTGIDFWAFKDIQEKGEKSVAADWYEIESFDNPETDENEFSYKGWAGWRFMPEMNKTITSDPEEMPFEGNLESKSAKQHIIGSS